MSLCTATIFIPHKNDHMAITSCFKDLIFVAVLLYDCICLRRGSYKSTTESVHFPEQSRGKAQTHYHPDSPSRPLLIHFQMFPVLLLQEPKTNMKQETYSLQLNKFILLQQIVTLPFKVWLLTVQRVVCLRFGFRLGVNWSFLGNFRSQQECCLGSVYHRWDIGKEDDLYLWDCVVELTGRHRD